MKLDTAISILVRCHTDEDRITGFRIETMPRIEFAFDRADYAEAWRTLRSHLGVPVDPPTPDTGKEE